MENPNHNGNSQERASPMQYVRGSRAFRQFKNPPQPHMCIQDTIKDTTEKLYINVLGWQKIANPRHCNDPIPLYGGMQVPQACGPASARPPLLVFAVMVNPDILRANGKNAGSARDQEALVSLLSDFVEAMNPGLVLARNAVILKDRDVAGELKDVWLAVQQKREREKGMNQDVMYKVYDIDGIGNEESNGDNLDATALRDPKNDDGPNTGNRPLKSSKQILMNAGQKSEFDSGMNNTQITQSPKDTTPNTDTTYSTPVYGQIVSTRENHNQINDIQQKLAQNESKPSSSFRKDWNPVHGKTTEGWDEFSKRSISTMKCEGDKKSEALGNGKHYDFFPTFDNKAALGDDQPDILHGDGIPSVSETNTQHNELYTGDSSDIILEPMRKLGLHPTTDNKICDNKTTALSPLSS